MGPPKFIGGNYCMIVCCAGRKQNASMGPPKFIGGNTDTRPSITSSSSASMGPPKFIGGNVRIKIQCSGKRSQLQWGHRNSSVEMRLDG